MARVTAREFQETIETGVVYYFSDPNIRSGEPHYCILLNDSPREEAFLIFVPATTLDIWSAISAEKYPRETIVDLAPEECPFLHHPSLFNCNLPIVRHIDVLTAKAVSGALKVKAKAPMTVVERLRAGVLASRLVSGKVKKLLR